MALNPQQKAALTTELEEMKQRSNGHKAKVKLTTQQIANLTKQLQTHEKNASDTESAIANVQAVINAG
jgi:hypothetical protein